MNFIFRQVNENDWKQYRDIRLEALQNDPQAFGASYTDESQKTDIDWQRLLSNPTVVRIAAQDEQGQFISTVGASEKETGIWKIQAIYTRQAYRAKGVGKQLLAYLITFITNNKGAGMFELMVNIGQEAAVRLYKSCGFEIVGIDEGHVMGDGKAYDSYIMKKEIIKK